MTSEKQAGIRADSQFYTIVLIKHCQLIKDGEIFIEVVPRAFSIIVGRPPFTEHT